MTGTDMLYLDIVQPFPPRHANLIGAGDMEAFRGLAKKHCQFMLVYWRLQGIAADNPAVISFLKANEAAYLRGVALGARHEVAERKIISILAGESIPSLVIKGSSLAREVYGDINSRSSSDIDMLVRHGDMAAVDRLLSQAGFVRQGDRKLEFDLLRIHHTQYLNPADNIYIEIHWHFAVPCFFSLPYEDIWAGVRKRDEGNYALSVEMNIILLLMHHHSHSFRQFRVLTDILWLFHRYRDSTDWRLLLPALKQYGLANTAAIVCGQIEELWGSYAGELPLAYFRQAGMGGPGRLAGYFRIYPGAAEKPVFLDKIAKRLALDGSRRVFMSFARALFPPMISIRRSETNENFLMVYCRYLKHIIEHWLRRK